MGGGLGGGRADLAALDHNGAVEAAGFQFPEDGGEIDLARAKLDHDVGFAFAVGAGGDGAIFGAETGDVREEGLEFGDGIFAGVVDDVAGVIPDFEIGVADGFDGRDDFLRGAAAAAVGLHDELDAALLGVGGGVGHDFEIVGVALGFVLAEGEGEFDAHRVAVGDLLAGVGDGLGERERGFHAEGGHIDPEAAGGDLGLQRGEVFRRGVGAGEDVVLGGGEEAGEGVAGGFGAIEGFGVGPLGPRAVEAADRPAGGRGRGGQGGARQEADGESGGGGGEELTAGDGGEVHAGRGGVDGGIQDEGRGRATSEWGGPMGKAGSFGGELRLAGDVPAVARNPIALGTTDLLSLPALSKHPPKPSS